VVRQLGGRRALRREVPRMRGARAAAAEAPAPASARPLWQQRKRAADLLAVASRFGSFPILLETYRECLRDVFDMPALVATLRDRGRGTSRSTVDSTTPSPFAASLLFGYVANYLYDGDAPLAERRAQALTIDQAQLASCSARRSCASCSTPTRSPTSSASCSTSTPLPSRERADGLHDLLLRLGRPLGRRDPAAIADGAAVAWRCALVTSRRAIEVQVGGEPRVVAVEDASRYRDALGVPLPQGCRPRCSSRSPTLPATSRCAMRARTARSRPTTSRRGSASAVPDGRTLLHRLVAAGRLLEGEFRPGGIRPRVVRPAGARDRPTAVPRPPPPRGRAGRPGDARAAPRPPGRGTTRRRRGLDALLDVVEHLQGAPLVASLVESAILPARLDDFSRGVTRRSSSRPARSCGSASSRSAIGMAAWPST
jgi:ATP-dependent helicase Lhr and Lhr-like helicase